MAFLHFPHKPDARLNKPEDCSDPTLCDVALSRQVLQLALLLEDVHLVHGHGAVTVAHTEADVDFLGQACLRVARRIKAYL